jgi:hypothetical protein
MSKLIHRRRSAVLAGLGTAAALSLLVACGGNSGGDGDTASKNKGVASIDSPSASGAGVSASAAAESGRPQLRLDTSEEEEARLWQVFSNCLYKHGVPGSRKPGSTGISVDADIDKYPDAYKACN